MYNQHVLVIVLEMEKKRFSEQEKNFLLHLINKYKNVVENKETDGATLQEKRKAWTEIQERFNCESDHLERTVTQLQKCWDNIKTKRKRQLAAAKRARLATGGGPMQISKDDDSPADAIILNATNVEFEDALDSDTVMLLTCASEQNQNYELSSEVFVAAQPLATVEESASAENEVPQIDLNVTSKKENEEPDLELKPTSAKRRKTGVPKYNTLLNVLTTPDFTTWGSDMESQDLANKAAAKAALEYLQIMTGIIPPRHDWASAND